MENNTNFEQIKELIEKSQNTLLLLSGEADEENIIAGIALQQVLEGRGKSATLYCASKAVERVNFLEKARQIHREIAPENLIISLGYDKEEIEKVGYETRDGRFNLVITPKKGRIDSSQISFLSEGINTDLIIVLGAMKLEQLGNSYTEHKEEFLNKGIINIDNHEGNDLFGSVNIVENHKVTLAEILMTLFDYLGVDFRSEIGNLLLMGIYLDTNSFRAPTVNSQIFLTVSELLQKGANLQYVVSKLYTKGGQQKEVNPQEEKDNVPQTLNPSTPPTPFVKNQKDQIEIEEPPVFRSEQF